MDPPCLKYQIASLVNEGVEIIGKSKRRDLIQIHKKIMDVKWIAGLFEVFWERW